MHYYASTVYSSFASIFEGNSITSIAITKGAHWNNIDVDELMILMLSAISSTAELSISHGIGGFLEKMLVNCLNRDSYIIWWK